MATSNYEKYDDSFFPSNEMFECVNESNYLQYSQIANVQYNFLLYNKNTNGNHFINWRGNFANLHEFIVENSKSGKEIINFLKSYGDSAPELYSKLGLAH
jgi:hypothetical protein